ncbi:MAG: phosphotransferase [Hydrogenophaga sp.]|uniref:hypothetical protein n=1 Tax=Hydrogenophaga sp. TaxID=1904254 RepID=UPI0026077DC1|nr:hypothetical protein [Hydrogenophaga sp.]MCW5672722.1 phosphotransferase [Hydrogenophaga sp.]
MSLAATTLAPYRKFVQTSLISPSTADASCCLKPNFPVFPKPAASVACHRAFLDFLTRFNDRQIPAEYATCASRIKTEFDLANNAPSGVRRLEEHVSANVCALLIELCYKAHLPLLCVHQLPTDAASSMAHRADIGIVPRDENSAQPDDDGYLGAIEVKLSPQDDEKTKFQLMGYHVGMQKTWSAEASFPVFVGAVITSGGLSVYGALAEQQLTGKGTFSLAWVPLAKVLWGAATAAQGLYAFLTAVVDCAQYRKRRLPTRPIEPDPRYHVWEELNTNVLVLQGAMNAQEKIVCKVYDYHPLLRDHPVDKSQRRRPNIGIIRQYAAGYLRNARLETFGPDVQLLYYDFIDAGERPHFPSSYRHLVAACKALRVLHNAGIVHGDIRIANILYYGDNQAALIDFDFAGRAGIDSYPLTMASIPERHPEARGGELMQKAHDIYSMWFVVSVLCDTASATAEDRQSLAKLIAWLNERQPAIRHPDDATKCIKMGIPNRLAEDAAATFKKRRV